MTDTKNIFEEKGYVLIRNFLPEIVFKTLERYLYFKTLRYPETNQSVPEEGIRGTGHSASSYSWYADPLVEVILENSANELEKVTGLNLYPTYSYSRVYTRNNILPAHVDREPCEVSVTCNIANQDKSWPFYLLDQKGLEVCVELEPGDAVVYGGCKRLHWRGKMEQSDWVVQIMLHYVDANGPYAGFKNDQRTSLGMPFPF